MHALIVGAGIGGLAAATALRRAGHEVTVLERSAAVSEVGAGVGLGPNAVGALTALGVAPRLKAKISSPTWTMRRRWEDGSFLFQAPLARTVVAHGYPFWFAHRGDLQASLLETALDPDGPGSPVAVHLGARVKSVDPVSGELQTMDGATFRGDFVIVADGIQSSIRRQLFDMPSPQYSGHSGFRTQVYAEDVAGDPAIAEFFKRNSFETWLGPGAHVVHCPFRNGAAINVTACIQADAIESGASASEVSLDETLSHLEGWDDSLRHLISRGRGVTRYDIYTQPQMNTWVQGRLSLLGDACHPMLPYLGQGAAQAIEDGEAIGAAMTDVDDPEDGLRVFEELRVGRATRVQALSAANAKTYHLPDGLEQQERDSGVAKGVIDSEVTAWLWRYQDPTTQTVEGAVVR